MGGAPALGGLLRRVTVAWPACGGEEETSPPEYAATVVEAHRGGGAHVVRYDDGVLERIASGARAQARVRRADAWSDPVEAPAGDAGARGGARVSAQSHAAHLCVRGTDCALVPLGSADHVHEQLEGTGGEGGNSGTYDACIAEARAYVRCAGLEGGAAGQGAARAAAASAARTARAQAALSRPPSLPLSFASLVECHALADGDELICGGLACEVCVDTSGDARAIVRSHEGGHSHAHVGARLSSAEQIVVLASDGTRAADGGETLRAAATQDVRVRGPNQGTYISLGEAMQATKERRALRSGDGDAAPQPVRTTPADDASGAVVPDVARAASKAPTHLPVGASAMAPAALNPHVAAFLEESALPQKAVPQRNRKAPKSTAALKVKSGGASKAKASASKANKDATKRTSGARRKTTKDEAKGSCVVGLVPGVRASIVWGGEQWAAVLASAEGRRAEFKYYAGAGTEDATVEIFDDVQEASAPPLLRLSVHGPASAPPVVRLLTLRHFRFLAQAISSGELELLWNEPREDLSVLQKWQEAENAAFGQGAAPQPAP